MHVFSWPPVSCACPIPSSCYRFFSGRKICRIALVGIFESGGLASPFVTNLPRSDPRPAMDWDGTGEMGVRPCDASGDFPHRRFPIESHTTGGVVGVLSQAFVVGVVARLRFTMGARFSAWPISGRRRSDRCDRRAACRAPVVVRPERAKGPERVGGLPSREAR